MICNSKASVVSLDEIPRHSVDSGLLMSKKTVLEVPLLQIQNQYACSFEGSCCVASHVNDWNRSRPGGLSHDIKSYSSELSDECIWLATAGTLSYQLYDDYEHLASLVSGCSS